MTEGQHDLPVNGVGDRTGLRTSTGTDSDLYSSQCFPCFEGPFNKAKVINEPLELPCFGAGM